MSNLVKHAEKELDLAGMAADSDDEMDRAMREHVITMVKAFSDEGHSGTSGSIALSILKNLLDFRPITPLTGDDSEWDEPYGQKGIQQNNRMTSVFRDRDGSAYWTQGRIFWEWFSSPDIEDGKPYKTHFTSRDSRVDITFPWLPPATPEYVFLPTAEFPNEELI